MSQLMPVELKVEKAAEAGAGEATGAAAKPAAGEATGAAAKPAAETTSEAEPADEAAAEPTGPNRWNFRFWKRRPARRKIQTESIVHMPDGTTQSATRMWIRNNGTGTWHGYPMP